MSNKTKTKTEKKNKAGKWHIHTSSFRGFKAGGKK